jgi:pimeloyl-ACP methyl ester carboxylesterase
MTEIHHQLHYPFPTYPLTLGHGYQIAYTELGKGPETLLFIHGMGSNMKAWIKNLPVLAGHFRCLALDLPGYGQSTKHDVPISMAFYAQTITEWMDALSIEKVWLVGHSMGGQIAMHTALASPDRIKGLVLAAPAGFETFTAEGSVWLKNLFDEKALWQAPAEVVRKNMEANFYVPMPGSEQLIADRLAYLQAEDYPLFCRAVALSISAMLDAPVFPLLPDLAQPVLVFFGEEDRYIPTKRLNPVPTSDIARLGCAALPKATCQLLPACGHFVPLEKPEIFNLETIRFITNH